MYASRGSMDLSKKDGGLPPDSVVQNVDKILKDSQKSVEKYHNPAPNSMEMDCSSSMLSVQCKRRTVSVSQQSLREIWRNASTHIYAKQLMKRIMFLRNTANDRLPIWKT